MLRNLVNLAEKLERREELVPLGYKRFSSSSPIDWVISIQQDGTPRAREASIDQPRPIQQRSGKPSDTNLKPYLLVDQARYAIGLPEEGKEEEADLLYGGFTALVREAAEKTGDDALSRLSSYLDQGPIHEAIDADIDPRDVVTFDLGGDQLPFQTDAARSFWASYVEDAFTAGQEGTCSVCDENRSLLQTLPQKVTLMGETCQITSFNLSAFTSYGKEQTLNASLCFACGARAAQALNYLTKTNQHNTQLLRNPREGASPSLKDQLAVYWTTTEEVETETGEPVPVQAVLSGTLEGAFDDEGGDERQIEHFLHTPWHAKGTALGADESGIHLVVLSPNKARLVIRDWLDASVEDVRKNLRRFLGASRVEDPYGQDARSFGIRQLLGALAVSGVDPDSGHVESRREVPANQVRGMLRTAYAGYPPPNDLHSEAVRSLRNPNVWKVPWLNHQLVSILKLTTTWNGSGDEETMQAMKSEQLDPETTQPGYLCGRLMAVLEETQRRAADGQLNTTIVDRNYNAAATAPGSTLPRLFNQAETAHIPKIRKSMGRGIADWIRSDIEEIVEGLDAFPRTLDIDGQGQFALGFYHQRAKIRRAKQKNQNGDQDDQKMKEE